MIAERIHPRVNIDANVKAEFFRIASFEFNTRIANKRMINLWNKTKAITAKNTMETTAIGARSQSTDSGEDNVQPYHVEHKQKD